MDGKIDNEIVECAYNDELRAFPIRLREDKT